MADDSPSPANGDSNSQKSDPNTPNTKSNTSTPPPPSQVAVSEPTPSPLSQPVPTAQPPYAPPHISGASVAGLPPPPPFRIGMQFTPVVGFQNPSVPPPGIPPPGVSSARPVHGPGSLPPPMAAYQAPPGQVPGMVTVPRPFPPMANGYDGVPGISPHGAMPPPGIPRYPSPYAAMVRPGFPLRPPGAIGTVPVIFRPPVPGMLGVRPVIPPVVRPAVVPSVTPAEKPQTTIYIGKIATVENDFMLSILQFCGPVKHWIRAQDPTTGKPKGFGFYEFESAEGALRTIRLLSKLNIDGQELLVNVNQATKEYLQRYVEKKRENAKKAKESQDVGSEESTAEGSEKEQQKIEGTDKSETAGLSSEEAKNVGEPKSTENIDIANSAVVTDEEREADREAMEKIKNAIEERLRTNPLPPPPPPPSVDVSGMELAVKSKNGDDADVAWNATDHKNEVETSSEQNRHGTSSPDWSRKHDRRSRDREKEQETDRHDREAERERLRKEREQRRKLEDAERAYQARLRQWERREREKEKEWQYEREREKERERKRKKEIRHEEDEDDDEDDSRRRWHRSGVEDRRRRRVREKEDDLADRLKEEEEVAEAKRKAEEERLQQQHLDALRLISGQGVVGSEKIQMPPAFEDEDKANLQTIGESAHGNNLEDIFQNGSGDDTEMAVDNASETQQDGNAPSKKLGFGLVGSGKRTTVPSVFHEDEDEDGHKDKKLRPLVPIDYSAEEQQALQSVGSGDTPPHLAAAAEFAKRLSNNANPREERSEPVRERSRRSDKGGYRDKDRGDGDTGNIKETGKSKTTDTKKLLDAKQLIDTIPKTKDELFSYEINWAIYDKHQLQERMRPWISKKITEFLGEEEATLVDYIVTNTQEHVKAPQMLELLKSILDEEAEMFVLKMWRMLIFEIKRVEAGLLPVKPKA
ncbi:PREDICTED: RNA-binding protein 25-like isoform X3 [Tarenaya hassleriana]|uniref:RNA-binding protein 25-like isoform X3 n=1 Tax=Tarenaya hassleriana TaxID=28532 RepID=UPI00053C5F68|nr:PREDICTED: RNA-binding protein 25-like isoform X3 [Tarenaya hassleriana]